VADPDAPTAGEAGDEAGHRRRLKFRQRDDHAVELFKEACEHLDDAARVDRILIWLGRFYNPYVNAPIVDPDTRRRVREALERGDADEARRLLDGRLQLYARFDDVDPPRSGA
jgi:hypothetical protein